MRSFFTALRPPSLPLLRIELSKLQVLRLRTAEERVRAFKGMGEEGEREGVRVVGEEEEEEEDDEEAGGVGEDDWLLGGGKEEARCSRRRR